MHDLIPGSYAKRRHVRIENRIFFSRAACFPDVPDRLGREILIRQFVECPEPDPQPELRLVVRPVVPLDGIYSIEPGNFLPCPSATGCLKTKIRITVAWRIRALL